MTPETRNLELVKRETDATKRREREERVRKIGEREGKIVFFFIFKIG